MTDKTPETLAKAAYDAALAAAVSAATAHDFAQRTAYIANRAAERAEAVYNAATALLDAANIACNANKESEA